MVCHLLVDKHSLLQWCYRYDLPTKPLFPIRSLRITASGMYHSGIGGGGFVLVRASNGSYEFIDFREAAPAAAFEQMYDNNINASLIGGLSR